MKNNNVINILAATGKFGSSDNKQQLIRNFILYKGKKENDESIFGPESPVVQLSNFIEKKKNAKIKHYCDLCDDAITKIKTKFLTSSDPFIVKLKSVDYQSFKKDQSFIFDGLMKISNTSALVTLITSLYYNILEQEIFYTGIFLSLRNIIDVLLFPGTTKGMFIKLEDDEEYMEIYGPHRAVLMEKINEEHKKHNIKGVTSLFQQNIPITFRGKELLANKCVREKEFLENDMAKNIYNMYICEYVEPMLNINPSTRAEFAPLFVKLFVNFVYALFINGRLPVSFKNYADTQGNLIQGVFYSFMRYISPTDQLLVGLEPSRDEMLRNFYTEISEDEFGNFLSGQ